MNAGDLDGAEAYIARERKTIASWTDVSDVVLAEMALDKAEKKIKALRVQGVPHP
jgi:hypothetical protein